MIPYGRQWIDDADIQAVVDTLRSDWLTQGPAAASPNRAQPGVEGASKRAINFSLVYNRAVVGKRKA